MHFTAVESSTLATVSYDEARQLLQLEFRSRAVYHYFGVPATVHEVLLAAPSKGRYFNLAIRGHYAFARIPSLEAGAPAVPAQPEQGGAPWHAR
jgi:hypothetical protein